ncbi:MAG TPA: biopolymer transporter ExbD [Haliangiales bacterium]|nr:biopolymer transporter ExbD [Haliangiales bacterium]
MRNDINVTPLVDVCLVLLIIFMAVNEKLQRGMDVPLPGTRHHAIQTDTGQPIVSVTREGIYWGRERLRGTDELKRRAVEARGRQTEPIHVKAGADLLYGEVYPVLIALKEAGSPGAELATQELKDAP